MNYLCLKSHRFTFNGPFKKVNISPLKIRIKKDIIPTNLKQLNLNDESNKKLLFRNSEIAVFQSKLFNNGDAVLCALKQSTSYKRF